MEPFNLVVKFVKEGGDVPDPVSPGGGTGGIAATGDFLGIIFAAIACIAIITGGYFLYKKKLLNLTFKNLFVIGLGMVFVTGGIFGSGRAFAATPEIPFDPSINQITATIHEDGTIDYSNYAITNYSAKPLSIENASIKITDEAKDVQGLNSTVCTLRGFEGTLYNEIPGQEVSPLKDIKALDTNETTLLEFNSNIKPDIASALDGLTVYEISLTPIVIPEVYTASVNFSGGVISSFFGAPAGWTYNPENGYYEKEFPEDTEYSAILSQWSIFNIAGAIDFQWNTSKGTLNENTVFTTPLILKPHLDWYTWLELKDIANDISANFAPFITSTSAYYPMFALFAEIGDAKVLNIPHEGDTEDKLYMRIIDINHDIKATSTLWNIEFAGLTFMSENSIDKGYCYHDTPNPDPEHDTPQPGNWGKSDLRKNMNSWDGELYNLLSKSLGYGIATPVIKDYAKAYNVYDGEFYDTTILHSYDTFFVPSYIELKGTDQPGFGKEGYRYKYIDNSIWSKTFGKVFGEEFQEDVPILINMTWRGYDWVYENGLPEFPEDITDIKDYIKWLNTLRFYIQGSFPPAIDVFGTLERSVLPENYEPEIKDFDKYSKYEGSGARSFSGSLFYFGFPGGMAPVFFESCVAPCFCL